MPESIHTREGSRSWTAAKSTASTAWEIGSRQWSSIGELKRIRAQVDCDLEMSTITYMSGKTVGGPALLFENIKGHPGPECCSILSAAA